MPSESSKRAALVFIGSSKRGQGVAALEREGLVEAGDLFRREGQPGRPRVLLAVGGAGRLGGCGRGVGAGRPCRGGRSLSARGSTRPLPRSPRRGRCWTPWGSRTCAGRG